MGHMFGGNTLGERSRFTHGLLLACTRFRNCIRPVTSAAAFSSSSKEVIYPTAKDEKEEFPRIYAMNVERGWVCKKRGGGGCLTPADESALSGGRRASMLPPLARAPPHSHL